MARVGFVLAALVGSTTAGAAGPRVEIGYCTDDLERAKAAGFDYAELAVRNFARLSEDDFAKLLLRQKAVGIPTPTGLVFLPTDMKVVGPDVDEAREMDYVRTAFARAEALGIGLIVLGSGPSRAVPEGFSKDEAIRQLVSFGRRIAPEAARHHIVLGVEAQRKEETNIINNLAEALVWVQAVDHPSFQLIVDFYHLALEHEDPVILLKAAGRIRHVHFANPIGRVFPKSPDDYDYSGFFENLRKIGYRGRISLEAHTEDLDRDAPLAIAFLRAAMTSGVRRPQSPRRSRAHSPVSE
jgi:D-psicose/D-tagatose/L-ribulose 3-epimerase